MKKNKEQELVAAKNSLKKELNSIAEIKGFGVNNDDIIVMLSTETEATKKLPKIHNGYNVIYNVVGEVKPFKIK